ncbi:hypothetical protein BC826DRAFT_721104 [Russula brevipes]|nr:hypothetical protein BC826DRAFT_721104 [Russula brevipes]
MNQLIKLAFLTDVLYTTSVPCVPTWTLSLPVRSPNVDVRQENVQCATHSMVPSNTTSMNTQPLTLQNLTNHCAFLTTRHSSIVREIRYPFLQTQRHRRVRERATGDGTIATANHNGSERMSISELYERLCISRHQSPKHPTLHSLSASTESENVLLFKTFVSNLTVLQNIQPVRSSHRIPFSPFAGTTSSSSERTCYSREHNSYRQ